MSHLADGTLRRLVDEPAGDADARHLTACPECRARFVSIQAAAAAAQAALASPEPPRGDAAAALAAVRARAFDPPANGGRRSARRPAWLPFGAVAAVVALALVAWLSPLRSLAGSFLAVFEPQELVAIPVTRADLEALRALPDLDAYGTVREGPHPMRATVADARSAALLAGAPVRVPSFLPAGLPRPSYHVMARTTATFTFSAAKATLAASASGRPLPPMSPRLDHSRLAATIGPIVLTTYGGPAEPAALRGRYRRDRHGFSGPLLVIAQAPAPRITSDGASAREIESYLLGLPGIPPLLAAQIRAIGDPTTALPIPIPIEREVAQHVVVQGVAGLGILDNTGLGSGVLWERDGTLYAVAGRLGARDILAVANSLK